MSEKENFLEGFKKADIKKSAEMDIKPRLTVDSIGVENGVDVVISSEPYRVQLPEGKGITKDGKIWMLDMWYQGVEHQFIAQAGSFRYQYGVLAEKHFNGKMVEIIGRTIKISKVVAEIDTTEFKGKAEVYQLALLD